MRSCLTRWRSLIYWWISITALWVAIRCTTENPCPALPLLIHWIFWFLSLIQWSIKACVFWTLNWIWTSLDTTKGRCDWPSVEISKTGHSIQRLSEEFFLCLSEIILSFKLVIWGFTCMGWFVLLQIPSGRSWHDFKLVKQALSLLLTFIFL